MAANRLTWWEDIGLGYYPVAADVYDTDYFVRYQAQAKTAIGRKLMKARVDFVNRHWSADIIDIGIGGGAFIAARNRAGRTTLGYDINPVAKGWLMAKGCWYDLEKVPEAEAISMWDVIEHIPDFVRTIEKVQRWVFLSLPIFDDAAHVLRSKHFRKDEHVWYFTDRGIKAVFDNLGFDLVEANDEEIKIGREDIGSYAFKRRDPK